SSSSRHINKKGRIMSHIWKILILSISLPALYVCGMEALFSQNCQIHGSALVARAMGNPAPNVVISIKEAEQKFQDAYQKAMSVRRKMKIKVKVKSKMKLKKQRITTRSDSASRSLSLNISKKGPDTRPDFFKVDERLKYEQYVWDGHVDSFNSLFPDEVPNRNDYILAKTTTTTQNGKALLELTYTSAPKSDDQSEVKIMVQADTFNPVTVEHRLLKPYKSIGVKLNHYLLRYTIETRNNLWLITAAEEKYSYLDIPQGLIDVEHSYTVIFKEPKAN
ncbi:hypothetical protein ACFL27_13275, partial [candidate division CSSED10-310 bacterium]